MSREANETVADCAKCLRSNLNDCEDFRRLTLKERLQFVQKSGLCFDCLCTGNLARNCRIRLTCKDCKKPCLTSLHFPLKDKEKEIKIKEQRPKSDRRVEIELSKLYSRDVIPSRKNRIPTPATADNWPHLRRILKINCIHIRTVCVLVYS